VDNAKRIIREAEGKRARKKRLWQRKRRERRRD
jgi:hypothetical protein